MLGNEGIIDIISRFIETINRVQLLSDIQDIAFVRGYKQNQLVHKPHLHRNQAES